MKYKIMDRILNKVIYEWNSLSSIKQTLKKLRRVRDYNDKSEIITLIKI